MLRASVEFVPRKRGGDARERRQRIMRALGISDMPLLAARENLAVERAATADFHHVAERVDIGGFADDAVIETLAPLPRPVEQLRRAVDRGAFLVAGDEEGNRALRDAVPDANTPRPRRRRRRWRPSCPRRRARRFFPPRPRRKTGRSASGPCRPAAPHRYGRRRRGAARLRRSWRRDCRHRACRPHGRFCARKQSPPH